MVPWANASLPPYQHLNRLTGEPNTQTDRQTDRQTHHATSRRMQQQPAFMLCCACMRRTLKATSCTCNPSAVGRSATPPRSISCRALARSVHFAAIFVYRAHTKLIPFCHFTAHKTPPSRRRRKRRTGKSPHLIASYERRACGRGASSWCAGGRRRRGGFCDDSYSAFDLPRRRSYPVSGGMVAITLYTAACSWSVGAESYVVTGNWLIYSVKLKLDFEAFKLN